MFFEVENPLLWGASLILVLVLGGFVGAHLAWTRASRGPGQALAVALAVAEERRGIIDAREKELSNLRGIYGSLEKEKASLETQRNALELQKQQLEENSKKISESLELKFSSLAHRILDEKTKKFDESSKQELLNTINPLKEKIKEFQENINKKHETNLQEQASLKKEIQFIAERGKEMTVSAESLSRALRGDSKAQGRWGEMLLEKILENSGLRKGKEFFSQSSYQSAEGNLQRPDITINLSNQKQIFVDSKVSLTHYDKYIRAESDLEKAFALDELEDAFCTRIKELGDKKYHSLEGVTTLDFVILFTPIESAFSLVVQHYEESKKKTLFEFAWEKGVIIASPLILMPILKTINVCWVAEYQNTNALAIVEAANSLHDKFVGFAGEFEKIQTAIERAQGTFEKAKNALVGSRGLAKGFDKLRIHLRKEKKALPSEYFGEDEFIEDLEDFVAEDNQLDCIQASTQETS